MRRVTMLSFGQRVPQTTAFTETPYPRDRAAPGGVLFLHATEQALIGEDSRKPSTLASGREVRTNTDLGSSPLPIPR